MLAAGCRLGCEIRTGLDWSFRPVKMTPNMNPIRRQNRGHCRKCQAFLSTTFVAAACTVVAPVDAEDEPLEGEDVELAVGVVWSLVPAVDGVAGPLLAELAVDNWPANPGR
jgi:hypothetical protein